MSSHRGHTLRNRVIISSQEVKDIVDGLARARNHLAYSRTAFATQLIKRAENKLMEHIKEKEGEDESSDLR